MTKKSKQSTNESEQLVQFRRRDAQRIGNAVHAHETSRRGRNPSSLPRAAGAGSPAGVVTATFLGSWLRNSENIVYLTQDPSTATAVAINTLFDISGQGSAFPRVAILADDPSNGSRLLLVNYEC